MLQVRNQIANGLLLHCIAVALVLPTGAGGWVLVFADRGCRAEKKVVAHLKESGVFDNLHQQIVHKMKENVRSLSAAAGAAGAAVEAAGSGDRRC